MPETEPTAWELMRMLRTIDGKVDKLVTREAFEAESRRVDDRFAAMGQDIVDERVAREKALAAERAAREKAEQAAEEKADRLRVNLRWLAASILVPVALFLIERFGGGA